jgi:hypothetical protein
MDDLIQGILDRKKKREEMLKTPARRFVGGNYPGHPFVPQLEPTKLTLIIHEQKCKNCGNVERYSNRHLLASYPPPADHVQSVYAGKLPLNIPIEKTVRVEEHGQDYCDRCFLKAEGEREEGRKEGEKVE